MSTEVLIRCDHCYSVTAAVKFDMRAILMLRHELKKKGWHQVGSKDYCMGCAPKHKKPKKG